MSILDQPIPTSTPRAWMESYGAYPDWYDWGMPLILIGSLAAFICAVEFGPGVLRGARDAMQRRLTRPSIPKARSLP